MSGYLSYLLGLLVIIIGVVVVMVLRKGKKEEEDSYEDISSFSEPPPVSPVRTREVEPAFEPEAQSIDEIDLHEEDDLFAQHEEPSAEAPVPSFQESQSTDELDTELADVDLEEFDLPQQEAQPVEKSQNIEDLNLDEEFDFLGDVDEGDTQLELAQAYLEMGDQAGAREILLEVAEDGSDSQKEKARQMLEQLG